MLRDFLRAIPARQRYSRRMYVLIAALVLCALFGATGLRAGAIRGIISLAGIIVGGMLALPLGPSVAPLVTMAGLTHPLWAFVLPPVVIFVGFQILFAIIAMVVHNRVEWFYKYHRDEEQYSRWFRLNSRLGICLGLVVATAYMLVLSVAVYAAGYLTYQFSTNDAAAQPAALKHLNQARLDLQSTGLDKAAAAMDPAPPGYYAAADLLGLIYHNPALQGRLGNYPALLALAERPEFQELAKDTQFNELLMTKPPLEQILNHPKVVPILNSSEVMKSIRELSPKDVLEFVQNGKSPLYDGEKLLGRWQLEVPATVADNGRRNLKATALDIRKLRTELEAFHEVNFIATPEKIAVLRVGANSARGTWSGAGDKYALALEGNALPLPRIKGKFDEANLVDGRLQLRSSTDDFSLLFEKAY